MLVVKVWVLLMISSQNGGSAPFVIENIASREECERVGQLMTDKSGEDFRAQRFRCVEVEKVITDN